MLLHRGRSLLHLHASKLALLRLRLSVRVTLTRLMPPEPRGLLVELLLLPLVTSRVVLHLRLELSNLSLLLLDLFII